MNFSHSHNLCLSLSIKQWQFNGKQTQQIAGCYAAKCTAYVYVIWYLCLSLSPPAVYIFWHYVLYPTLVFSDCWQHLFAVRWMVISTYYPVASRVGSKNANMFKSVQPTDFPSHSNTFLCPLPPTSLVLRRLGKLEQKILYCLPSSRVLLQGPILHLCNDMVLTLCLAAADSLHLNDVKL